MDDDYYSSEDEQWEYDEKPLINVFTFGWLEDGRCGYTADEMSAGANIITKKHRLKSLDKPKEAVDIARLSQLCPKPVGSFEIPMNCKQGDPKYICKKMSTGSRHSLFLLIDSSKNLAKLEIDPEMRDKITYRYKRKRKVYLTGLNQVGLCEEKGQNTPIEVTWSGCEEEERPVDVIAGRGTSFIITKAGHLYSSGHGRYGLLGQGHYESIVHPQRVIGLERKLVVKVAAGGFHVIALTDENMLYGWGRNQKGQLGIGYENNDEHPSLTHPEQRKRALLTMSQQKQQQQTASAAATDTNSNKEDRSMIEGINIPQPVQFTGPAARYKILDISCGFEHTICMLQKKTVKKRTGSMIPSSSGAQPVSVGLAAAAVRYGGGGKDYNNNNNATNSGGGNSVDALSQRAAALLANREKAMATSTNATTPKSAAAQAAAAAANTVPEEDIQYSTIVFGWGDESQGQLGSGDEEYRFRPQENRWLTRLSSQLDISFTKIVAGGFHNLALVKHSGQVISWGQGEYGQLGHGLQFNDPTPKLINNLEKVIDIAAGLRHSLCVCESLENVHDVLGWGYNAYGELGLGDCNIRLQPTKITAFRNTQVVQVSCGDRHSGIVISYKPLRAREMPSLKPYFTVLREADQAKEVMQSLKYQLNRQGIDGNLLDDPDKIIANQAGMNASEIKNDLFEKGLRYCLDTFSDPFDWRRKALEACFECITPKLILKKVCLSCARNCLSAFRLRPYIRQRKSSDTCDCHTSGLCMSIWTPIRAEFDKHCGEDGCIGPNQVRTLLKKLRTPFPVETADVDDCLSTLADGIEDTDQPRLRPGAFEKWYRRFYDEEEEVEK